MKLLTTKKCSFDIVKLSGMTVCIKDWLRDVPCSERSLRVKIKFLLQMFAFNFVLTGSYRMPIVSLYFLREGTLAFITTQLVVYKKVGSILSVS